MNNGIQHKNFTRECVCPHVFILYVFIVFTFVSLIFFSPLFISSISIHTQRERQNSRYVCVWFVYFMLLSESKLLASSFYFYMLLASRTHWNRKKKTKRIGKKRDFGQIIWTKNMHYMWNIMASSTNMVYEVHG